MMTALEREEEKTCDHFCPACPLKTHRSDSEMNNIRMNIFIQSRKVWGNSWHPVKVWLLDLLLLPTHFGVKCLQIELRTLFLSGIRGEANAEVLLDYCT